MPAPVAYSPLVVVPAPVYAYAPVATVAVVPARPYAFAAPPAYGYGGTARSYGYQGPRAPAYGYSNSGYAINSGPAYYGTQ